MSDKQSFTPKLALKRYEASKHESILFNLWQKEQIYAFNAQSQKPFYTIDTPPPYTNSQWHLGSAIHYSQIDMIARTMRMQGYEVLFPMGLDRNGLPIEIQTERENNIHIQDISREKFLTLCKDLLNRYGDSILGLAHKLGLSNNSFEWDKVYKTDEDQYRALTQATFIELMKTGYIYEDNRPNNWDPVLQTTIADAEIEYEEGPHTLYDIKFELIDTQEPAIISTSRPELLPAIGIIIYHPSDTRYQHLEGKFAQIPIWNKKVMITSHPSVDKTFGRGIMMVCSFGDITDVRIYRELGLTPTYVIGLDGKMNDNAGQKYANLSIVQARKAIVADLKKLNTIVSEKEISHRYPISDRSKSPIEFIGMPELYLKQISSLPTINDYTTKMQFYPERARNILFDWLGQVTMDWPITRRRYYGTEVPLWYCNDCSEILIPDPGPYYQPWKDPAPFAQCPKCGGHSFRGDKRIFDTWMDSSISAYYILCYPENRPAPTGFLAKLIQEREYICDIRPQGKEIVRTWLYYSLLRGQLLFHRSMFKSAWISGHVVTETGEKMSKSKGTNIAPEPFIEKFGGDALRLFGASEASHGSDIRFSEERLAGTAKFLNKLYNIARFISGFPEPAKDKQLTLATTDKWILTELSQTIKRAVEGYKRFDFNIPANELRQFTWDIFAGTYLELVKARAYNTEQKFSTESSNAARQTLYVCLDVILKLLAPIIPFITDYIYREIYARTIHVELFPAITGYHEIHQHTTQWLITLNTEIRKLKEQYTNNSDKSKQTFFTILTLPKELQGFKDDLNEFYRGKAFTHEEKDLYNKIEKNIPIGDGIMVKILL